MICFLCRSICGRRATIRWPCTGYYRKFWSRNTAYPYLGFNEFIAAEDFVNPHTRRGFISDAAMTQRIIEEYEAQGRRRTAFHPCGDDAKPTRPTTQAVTRRTNW